MPAGRPSKYGPHLIEKLAEIGQNGEGIAEACVHLGITRPTWAAYREQHPEFLAASNEFLARSEAWWERTGRRAANGEIERFSATAYIFNVKNRFPQYWRDVSRTEITGPDGAPVQSVSVDPTKVSTEALRELLAAMGKRPDEAPDV